jgi:hypothetical protein
MIRIMRTIDIWPSVGDRRDRWGHLTAGGASPRPRLPSVCTRPSFAISVTTWAPVGAAWQAPDELQCACLAGGAGVKSQVVV